MFRRSFWLLTVAFFTVCEGRGSRVLDSDSLPSASVASSSVPASVSPDSDGLNKRFVLSIDGGGIRGLIPVIVMEAVETYLTDHFGGGVAIRASDIFNVMAGTSTGSIISMALAVPHENSAYRPQYAASMLVDLYRRQGERIFSPKSWGMLSAKYQNNYLKGLLKSHFGNARLSGSIKGIHVLAPSFNLHQNDPVFFEGGRGTRQRQNGQDIFVDHFMRKAVRSSSAAPTFFPASEVNEEYWVDGGVFMNNPLSRPMLKRNFCIAISQEQK